jgi:GH24 family phage-related lysozyme (muramidase)
MAVAIVAMWEGGKDSDGSSVAYADKLAGGLPTVCSGLTRYVTTTPIVVGERWSAFQCFNEERTAIISLQLRLEQCFEREPAQQVFDAATSHAWNNGVSATCGSMAMRAWNAGQWELGCKRLAFSDSGRRVWSYVKSGDGYKFVRGLARRRDSEYHLCLTGELKA